MKTSDNVPKLPEPVTTMYGGSFSSSVPEQYAEGVRLSIAGTDDVVLVCQVDAYGSPITAAWVHLNLQTAADTIEFLQQFLHYHNCKKDGTT